MREYSIGTLIDIAASLRAEHVELLKGTPELVDTPSNSGKGQRIARCPTCRIAVWSHYAGAGDKACFVRVGTLDEPDRLPPDIHVFTASKQPWVVIPEGTPAFEAFYSAKEDWPADSLARREVGEMLTAAEELRAAKSDEAVIFGFENMLRLREQGLVDEDVWQNLIDNSMAGLGSERARELMAQRPGPLSQRLLTEIEARPHLFPPT